MLVMFQKRDMLNEVASKTRANPRDGKATTDSLTLDSHKYQGGEGGEGGDEGEE